MAVRVGPKDGLPIRMAVIGTPNDEGGTTVTVGGGEGRSSGDEFKRVADAFQSMSSDFISGELHRLVSALNLRGGDNDGIYLSAALAVVKAAKPRNEVESILALQITATHALAMQAIGKAAATKDSVQADRWATIATKAQRTMLAQYETMHRMRHAGKQKVTVRHVHVGNGGQAIVADRITTGGRPAGVLGNQGQAHAITDGTLDAAFTPLLPGADPLGGAVHVDGRSGEKPVPNARRSPGKRRTEGGA